MRNKLSIVIPVFNEQGNIADLVHELFAVVAGDWIGEVIVVDDASTDTSVRDVQALLPVYPALRLIRHQRNAGQSCAVHTGIRAARFELIATMDGDGQNPPDNIPRLAGHWRSSGPHLITGHRVDRRASLSKQWASRFANGIRQAILRDRCPDTGCGLKVFAREAYLGLPFFHGQHRYLPALMRARGYAMQSVPVTDRPRRCGQSKYTNLQRGLAGIPDLMGVAWLIRRSPPLQAGMIGDEIKPEPVPVESVR